MAPSGHVFEHWETVQSLRGETIPRMGGRALGQTLLGWTCPWVLGSSLNFLAVGFYGHHELSGSPMPFYCDDRDPSETVSQTLRPFLKLYGSQLTKATRTTSS